MLELGIPGFGTVRAEHLVSISRDLTVNGKLWPASRQLVVLASPEIHVVTSDTLGMVDPK
jgi:hypothetical protein